MRWLYAKNSSHIYQLLLRSIACLTLAFILLCTIPLYQQSRASLLEKIHESDLTAIRQSRSSIDTMRSIAGSITDQVFSDLNIAWLLYGKEYDSVELRKSMIQLNNYRASIPYIESIYIYNKSTDSITVSSNYNGTYGAPLDGSNRNFTDMEIVNIIHDNRGVYDRSNPIPRVILQNKYGQYQKLFLYTFIRSDTYGKSVMESAVFINFTYSWMEQMAHTDGENGAQSIIVDENGRVVSNSAAYPMGANLSQQAFYQDVLAKKQPEGSLIQLVDGVKMMVTFIAPDSNGWRCLRLVPYNSIVTRLNSTVRFTIILTLILATAAILASCFLSRVLYRPVGKAAEKMTLLEEENRQIHPMSRQNLLRNLLLGAASNSAHIRQLMPELHIPIDTEHRYQVVLIKIKNFQTFVNEHQLSEQGLFCYGIMNIAEEIIGRQLPVESVDTGEENGLVLLLCVSEQELVEQKSLEVLFRPVQEAVFNTLHLSLAFVVGPPCTGVEELSVAYRKTREAAVYRMFYPEKLVLLYKSPLEASEYNYPAAKEDAMKESITNGNAEKAKTILHEILLETVEYPYSVVNLTVAKLALLLTTITRQMQGGVTRLPEEADGDIMAATSLNEQTLGRFCHAIDRITESIEDKRANRHLLLLQRIDDIMQTSYENPDCSVETIARMVGLSSAHISRLYKRYRFQNISETIFALRMEKARMLLTQKKHLSVAEIAQQTGFASSSYFSKAFRKEHGTTPNEYRK